jgi:hypothetical protein
LLQKTITSNTIHLSKLKKRDPEEKIHIQKLNKYSYQLKDATISVGALIRLIEDNNWTIAASGAFFTTIKKVLLARYLRIGSISENIIEHSRKAQVKRKIGPITNYMTCIKWHLKSCKTHCMVLMLSTHGVLQMDLKYAQQVLPTVVKDLRRSLLSL